MNIYNLTTDQVPDYLVDLVMDMQKALGKDAYDFLLIGATARDLIISGHHKLQPGTVTRDIDFAIYIPEWESYDSIIAKLIATQKFKQTKIRHRLYYQDQIEVDLVHFGDIQNEQGEYQWPPHYDTQMNVAGFTEINQQGITVKLNPENLLFRVAPIQGICVMKVLAWKDRKYETAKDGQDLGFILRNYIELKENLVYEDHADLLADFDHISTGARIMGRDIAQIIGTNPIALQKVTVILNEELLDQDNSYLARTMQKGQSFSYLQAYRAIEEILRGINDVR